MFATILGLFLPKGMGLGTVKAIFGGIAICVLGGLLIAAFLSIKGCVQDYTDSKATIATQEQTIGTISKANDELADAVDKLKDTQEINNDVLTENKVTQSNIQESTKKRIETKEKKIAEVNKTRVDPDKFDPVIEKQISAIVINSMWDAYNSEE